MNARMMLLLFLSSCLSLRAFAQGSELAARSATVPGAASAPSESSPDALKVQEVVEQARARRAREKAELERKLRDMELELGNLKAKGEQLTTEIPAFERSKQEAKTKLDEAYARLAKVSDDYNAAEQQAKADFERAKIEEAQARYDAEYADQKARHEADVAFIETNKWHAEDLLDLSLAMDKEDASKILRVHRGRRENISGTFPTVDYDTGERTWHCVPPDTKFSVAVQQKNPFVAAVSLHPGSDILGCNSTNIVDWDIHFYVAKDFRQEKEPGKFYLVGISWPADLGRPMCWQAKSPPVFVPVPMPERQIADNATAEVAEAVGKWVFSNEGFITMLKGAQMGKKMAEQNLKSIDSRESTFRARIARKLADNKEKQADMEKQVSGLKIMLEEYEEELVEAAIIPSAPAPEAAAPGDGLGVEEAPVEGL